MSTVSNYGSISESIAEEAENIESSRQVALFEPLQVQEPTPAPEIEWYKMPFCCFIEVCACVLEACLPLWRR